MKNYFWVAIENILITAIFAIIAIYFEHWWIILFSVLGWTTIKRQTEK